jgi:hypothetical protein
LLCMCALRAVVWSGELAGPDAVVGLGASYELDAPRCIIYIQYIYIYIYI